MRVMKLTVMIAGLFLSNGKTVMARTKVVRLCWFSQ